MPVQLQVASVSSTSTGFAYPKDDILTMVRVLLASIEEKACCLELRSPAAFHMGVCLNLTFPWSCRSDGTLHEKLHGLQANFKQMRMRYQTGPAAP